MTTKKSRSFERLFYYVCNFAHFHGIKKDLNPRGPRLSSSSLMSAAKMFNKRTEQPVVNVGHNKNQAGFFCFERVVLFCYSSCIANCIYITRHGESQWNVEKKVQDVPKEEWTERVYKSAVDPNN